MLCYFKKHRIRQPRNDFTNKITVVAALWTLTTMLDTNKTLEYLAYLGYTFNNSHEDNQLSAINVTRDKKIDIARKQTARNVYRCHVVGPRDAGKTTFCQVVLTYI